MTGIAGGDGFILSTNRSQAGETFGGGAGTVAFVARKSHSLLARLSALAVLDQLGRREWHDLLIKASGTLRRGRALLADQRVLVLDVAADSIAPRDDIGGLDHRHPHFGLVTHEPLLGEVVLIEIALHKADGFDPAGNRYRDAIEHDPLGRARDRLKPGAAKPVDGSSRNRHRETGSDGR